MGQFWSKEREIIKEETLQETIQETIQDTRQAEAIRKIVNDMLKDKNNEKEFLSNAEFFINFERSYNFFQLVKILNFMGLRYQDLYLNNLQSEALRKTLY